RDPAVRPDEPLHGDAALEARALLQATLVAEAHFGEAAPHLAADHLAREAASDGGGATRRAWGAVDARDGAARLASVSDAARAAADRAEPAEPDRASTGAAASSSGPAHAEAERSSCVAGVLAH